MNDVVVLIPCYNPNKKLLQLISDLIKNDFQKIIVVNDGSNRNLDIFNKLKEYKNIDLLEYKENKGKGYALKYGINYYLENLKTEYKGIVMADADLQHSVPDIINISLKLLGNQDSLILGRRNFNAKKVPLSNKLGNKITSIIFSFLYGSHVHDTQTGLRGVPNRYLNLCLESKGKRFEYEMNMLIKFTKNHVNILEVPISTIYFKKSDSKFNKVTDSIMIYQALFTEYIKYGLTSFCAAIVDIIIFTFFVNTFNTMNNNLTIIIGTVLARTVSGFLNFNLTKYLVFKTHEKGENMLSKFYLHTFCNMTASAILVMLLHNLFPMIHESYFKLVVDTLIYLVGYKIQKKYIFKA